MNSMVIEPPRNRKQLLKRSAPALLAMFLLGILGPSFETGYTASANATEVVLKDGRVLRGKIGEVSGLADMPQPPDPEGSGPLQLILFMDDDLSRTFVSKRLVKEVRQDEAGQGEEKFTLHQRALHNGQIDFAASGRPCACSLSTNLAGESSPCTR